VAGNSGTAAIQLIRGYISAAWPLRMDAFTQWTTIHGCTRLG
jgi:hypothetical protein